VIEAVDSTHIHLTSMLYIEKGSDCPSTAAKDGDCPAMGADCPATGAKSSGCPAMGADCLATGAEDSGCPATAAKEGREFMDCFWGSATKGFQSSVLRKSVWFV